MTMRVWLYRLVVVPGKSGWFIRAVELPLSPFVGLKLMLRPGGSEERVEGVLVNGNGAVIVELERQEYTEKDFDDSHSAAEQFDWEARGWRADNTNPPLWETVLPPSEDELTPFTID